MIHAADGSRFQALPPHLVDLLICPGCRSDLLANGEDLACESPACGQRFRLGGTIPVLADEGSSPISFRPEGTAHNKSRAKGLALRYLPSLDLNVVPARVRERLIGEVLALADRPIVLNVGGKHPTSLTEQICEHEGIDAIECDLAHRKRTRIFANPASLPVADESVDAVLLDGLLEHVPSAQAVADEAWRVLKPNGIVYSDTPFMLQVHGGAFDYSRFSHQAHRWLFRNFDELESGVSSGPGVALSYAIQYFLLCFAGGSNSRYAIKTVTRLTLFWLKYFDLFLAERPAARDAAHGLYFLGRKAQRAATEQELVARYEGRVPNLYPGARRG
jgi:SAM-dependent methyltransferase/uncharacterized protein YbaR (Trm112 family)